MSKVSSSCVAGFRWKFEGFGLLGAGFSDKKSEPRQTSTHKRVALHAGGGSSFAEDG